MLPKTFGLALAVMFASLEAGMAVAETPKTDKPDSARRFRQWIKDLDNDQFEVREAASRDLLSAGKEVIPAVAAAVESSSLEVTTRALRILQEFSISAQPDTAKAAKLALVQLAASNHPGTAARARTVLRSRQHRIIHQLEEAGAVVSLEGDQAVTVNFDNAQTIGPGLRLLRELPDLQTVSLSNRRAGDAEMALLKGLPKLRDVNLYQSNVGDAGLEHLKHIPTLKWLPMGETKVTDAGLVHLKDMTQLEYLGLRGNRVTDAGLVHLKKLTNLQGLYLGETKVTDAGLVHLKPLVKLEYLYLHNTEITDAGLEQLKDLRKLERLYLWKTKATETGLKQLREALPRLKILNSRNSSDP